MCQSKGGGVISLKQGKSLVVVKIWNRAQHWIQKWPQFFENGDLYRQLSSQSPKCKIDLEKECE